MSQHVIKNGGTCNTVVCRCMHACGSFHVVAKSGRMYDDVTSVSAYLGKEIGDGVGNVQGETVADDGDGRC